MAGIHVGDKLPEATFRRLAADGPQEIKASGFFCGRKVVLLAVPGAFTPTCSVRRPSFLENADAIPGTRSLRYALVVDDGTVTALQVEESPASCTVTSGASILDSL